MTSEVVGCIRRVQAGSGLVVRQEWSVRRRSRRSGIAILAGCESFLSSPWEPSCVRPAEVLTRAREGCSRLDRNRGRFRGQADSHGIVGSRISGENRSAREPAAARRFIFHLSVLPRSARVRVTRCSTSPSKVTIRRSSGSGKVRVGSAKVRVWQRQRQYGGTDDKRQAAGSEAQHRRAGPREICLQSHHRGDDRP